MLNMNLEYQQPVIMIELLTLQSCMTRVANSFYPCCPFFIKICTLASTLCFKVCKFQAAFWKGPKLVMCALTPPSLTYAQHRCMCQRSASVSL